MSTTTAVQAPAEAVACSAPLPLAGKVVCGRGDDFIGTRAAYMVFDEKCGNKFIFGFIQTMWYLSSPLVHRAEVADARVEAGNLEFASNVREELENVGLSAGQGGTAMKLPVTPEGAVNAKSMTGSDLNLSIPKTGTCKDLLSDLKDHDQHIDQL